MKKILLAILLMAPLSIMAQAKFAHFNSDEVIPYMTEYIEGVASLQNMQKQFDDDLKMMQEEMQKKYEDYQKEAANLLEPVRLRREQELNDLGQRFQQSYQDNQLALQKAQQEMMAKISETVMAAVKKLGEVGGYVYVVDISGGAMAFVNPAMSTDITAQLKKELNVSDTPAPVAAPAAPAPAPAQ